MAAQSPLVSIVCTNFNKGEWIRDAIESFLAQECEFDYEIILIDDASTDASPKIIKEYAEKYPNRIRAFYNKKNLGITKTWIKVCKEARGRYIARCDGDDYWIDDRKLQKQVDLLEKNKDSLWCSTDYNIITPEGELVHFSAFESKLVDRSATYAQMLATKGFTMSSTWLVDTNLMREVNASIDSSAVDDTFNIQLDLFNKTKLTYLPEATVVYRLNDGSDSRPIEIEKIRSRNERLLKTQLEYIEKYKDIDYGEILKIILRRDMQNEMWAIERLHIIHDQKRHIEQQEARIKELESALRAITNSRSYRLATKSARMVWSMMKLPARARNKLIRLGGDYRYKKYSHKIRPTKKQLKHEQELSKGFSYQPLISIVTPTYNTPSQFLIEMINSVKRQTYPNWELVLIDDASPNENVRTLIQNLASDDKRITYKFLENNQHIAAATNEGFRLAKGEFVSLLDHDDILHPSALFETVKVLNENKDIDFIYTDEDKITADNKRKYQPFCKPGWNKDFLYSVNYITHFTTIRKSLLEKVGYEDSKYDGAQDWELFLRCTRNISPEKICHIPKILYSWRVHESSTAKELSVKPYVLDAQKRAIEDDLIASGHKNFSVQQDPLFPGQWCVKFAPIGAPKVSIIIPRSRYSAKTMKEIKARTTYDNYEVVEVDTDATIGNLANELAGEYFVFIRDRVKIQDPEWIQLLLGDAQRSDIGFVQARHKKTKNVIKNLSTILDPSALSLLKKMGSGNVSKHLYTTSRYNVATIHGGISMVEAEKLREVLMGSEKGLSVPELSSGLIQKDYRNLYNPYVKVLK